MPNAKNPTQRQSSELILYRLDELTRTTGERFDNLDQKLSSFNSTYLPRDEALLYRNETQKELAAHSAAIDLHNTMLTALKERDDRQQGAIQATRYIAGLIGGLVGFVLSLILLLLKVRP